MADASKIPVEQLKKLMKCACETVNFKEDAVHLIGKAAEMFIKMLAAQSLERNGEELKYDDLVKFVHEEDAFYILREILPKRITYGEILDDQEKKESNHQQDQD